MIFNPWFVNFSFTHAHNYILCFTSITNNLTKSTIQSALELHVYDTKYYNKESVNSPYTSMTSHTHTHHSNSCSSCADQLFHHLKKCYLINFLQIQIIYLNSVFFFQISVFKCKTPRRVICNCWTPVKLWQS